MQQCRMLNRCRIPFRGHEMSPSRHKPSLAQVDTCLCLTVLFAGSIHCRPIQDPPSMPRPISSWSVLSLFKLLRMTILPHAMPLRGTLGGIGGWHWSRLRERTRVLRTESAWGLLVARCMNVWTVISRAWPRKQSKIGKPEPGSCILNLILFGYCWDASPPNSTKNFCTKHRG